MPRRCTIPSTGSRRDPRLKSGGSTLSCSLARRLAGSSWADASSPFCLLPERVCHCLPQAHGSPLGPRGQEVRFAQRGARVRDEGVIVLGAVHRRQGEVDGFSHRLGGSQKSRRAFGLPVGGGEGGEPLQSEGAPLLLTLGE